MKENIFQQAIESDVDVMLDMERRSYTHPWSEGSFRDCFKVGYEVWQLIIEEQVTSLACYGIVSVAAGEAHLLNLCVDSKFRKQGFGRQMLGHLIKRAENLGADVMFLEVRALNKMAISLYLSEGFNEIGVRKGYYPSCDGREDAIVMAYQIGGF